MSLTRREARRYLALLRIPESKPSFDALVAIVRAHLMNVPFENISKLYRWKAAGTRDLPDCTQYLEGIERYHFGGTCYANNYHLYELLSALGYDAILCGADMSQPDVHMVSIVRLGGKEYIVDAGYAAPFLEPLPRDWPTDYVISLGADRYVLSPKTPDGRSQISHFRDGAARHGYLLNPAPRHIEEFRPVIADSFRPDATFMNAVLLVKFGVGHSTGLRNLELIESDEARSRTTSFKTLEELIAAIHKHFSIPISISRAALDGLSLRRDAWS